MKIVPVKILLKRPNLLISVPEEEGGDGPKNFLDVDEAIERALPKLRSIVMKEGELTLAKQPWQLKNLDCTVLFQEEDKNRLDLTGTVIYKKFSLPVTLRGHILPDTPGKDDPYQVVLETGEIPLSWLPWQDRVPVEGLAKAQITASGALRSPMVLAGKIKGRDCRFKLKNTDASKEYVLPSPEIDFTLSYFQSLMDVSSLELKGTDFHLKTRAKIDFRDSSGPRIELNADSPFMPLETFKEIFPTPLLPGWVEGRLFPMLGEGDARLERLSLKGTLDEIQNLNRPENAGVLSLAIDLKNIEVFKNTEAPPLTGVSASLSYDNASLLVTGVRAAFGGSLVRDGALSVIDLYDEDPLYKYSAEAVIDLADIRQLSKNELFPGALRQQLKQCTHLAGILEACVQIEHKNTWKYPRMKKSKFSFGNCSVTHNRWILPLSLSKADLKIDDAGLLALHGTGLWGTAPFQADGTGMFNLENGGGLNAELFVKTDHIDFSKILDTQEGSGVSPEGPGRSQSTEKPFMAPPNVRLHLEAASGRWKKLQLGRIEADAAFRDDAFFLNPSTVKLGKGHLSLKGHVKPEETFFSGDIRLTRHPIKALIESAGLELDILEADLTAQGTFFMKGHSSRELIPGLNGSFDLQLEQGVLKKSSFFFKFLNLLDVKRLVFKQQPGLSEEGLRFDIIQGHIDSSNGTLALKDIYMESPLLNATGIGTIDLTEETIDCVIGIEPLRKITELIDKIPLSGYVLTDRVKSLLVYYFDVKGPLSDPAVEHLSPKKLKEGTIRHFKSLFLTPKRLFTGPSKEKR
jgi:hypothetical protein